LWLRDTEIVRRFGQVGAPAKDRKRVVRTPVPERERTPVPEPRAQRVGFARSVSDGLLVAKRQLDPGAQTPRRRVLVTHPGIAEVAVIGLPDDEYGEIVTAVAVASTPDLTADDVIAFAREHLVRYKSPRRVELVDALPRDPMGKVRKRDLRDRFS